MEVTTKGLVVGNKMGFVRDFLPGMLTVHNKH